MNTDSLSGRQTLVKILTVVLTALTALLALNKPVSCNDSNTYNLLRDRSQIVSIEIVEYASDEVDDPLTEGTVLAVIEDREAFIDDFLALRCRNIIPIGSPLVMSYTPSPVIRIIYDNGEYELVTDFGYEKHVIEDDGSQHRINLCWEYFDREEYLEFVEQYI